MASAPYIGGSPYVFEDSGSAGIPVFGTPLPNHAGIAPKTDTGWDVTAPKLTDARRKTALNKTNGKLHDGTWFVDLFISDVKVGIALSGSTGQSRFTRDFYPHNMVMPSFVVVGQCLDQNDYGTLCEFVHQAQQKGVYDGNLLQLEVAGGGLRADRPIMKGIHKPIHAQGFINAMPRKHERFVYAPTFTFPFVVSTLFEGVYQESTAGDTEEESWAAILSQIVASSPVTETQAPKPTQLAGPPLAGGLGPG